MDWQAAYFAMALVSLWDDTFSDFQSCFLLFVVVVVVVVVWDQSFDFMKQQQLDGCDPTRV